MNDSDALNSRSKPFRRAVLSGLGVLLPPLLTLVVFLWAWSTIQRFILEPVEWTARSVIVWRIGDIVDEAPLVSDSKTLVKADDNGKTITFQRGNHWYVQIPREQWIREDVYEAVKKQPGSLMLTTANANQYYHQYVRIQYLKRQLVIPLFICVFVFLLYLLGKLLAARIGRIFLRTAEGIIQRLPFIRTVYSSVKQVTDFVFSEREVEFTRVVAVQYPRRGIWSIGFVTGQSMVTIQNAVQEPVLSILMPTSPMPATGFTITVCKSETIDLDITVDQAIQFIVSCGVVIPSNQTNASAVEVKTRIAAALDANHPETSGESAQPSDSSPS